MPSRARRSNCTPTRPTTPSRPPGRRRPCSAPAGQRPIDHYVVEAWQGTTLRAAQAVDAARHTATLSGVPAGATTVHVRAINGFAAGPDATTDATVPGAASTYAGAVTNAAPQLYWRLGERSGTLVADASGHGRSAAYSQPADQRTLASGLTSDPDSSVGAGVVWYGSAFDLIRSPLAAGLPTGNRTVEALVWADAPGAQLLSYGGFSVVEEDRGLAVGTTKLTLPADDDRKLTDSQWHHIALTYDGTALTFYLDGEAVASAPATLTNTAAGDLLAAHIPAGANVRYDELAVYDKVLDADTIAAHYALSGNPAPVDRRAPKPTIDPLTTTTTRPQLSGRLGELPGDLPKATVKITKDGATVLQRDVSSVGGAWSLAPGVLPTGELVLTVTQPDQAGNLGTATATWTVTNTAPDATLALDATDGPLPLTVHATVTGSDADNDPLTYRLDFGDGGVVTGVLPIAPIAHVYTRVGTFPVTLTVNDGTASVTKTSSVATRLAEPLKADAGDDQQVEAGQPLTFDGRASRPSVGIEHYHWTFSDGGQADGAVVSHTFADKGDATATLQVTAGSATSTDTAAVTVIPQSPAVTVTVTSGGRPVSGADVLAILADGRRIAGTAGGDGKAKLAGLPDGAQTIYAWAQGMRPGSGVATVSNGSGSATIALEPGEVASLSVDSHRMTKDEVVAAGINPDDPSNSQVYSFEAHIAIGDQTASVSGAMSQNGLWGCGGSGWQTSCGGGGGAYVYPSFQGGVPLLQWLVIPARTGFLKEFFNVSMVVQNLAGPDFTLHGGTASLDLPGGLSLAPTSTPQQASVSLPDIPGGGDASTSWVVRGDSEGSYEPTARYAATLNPIDLPVALQAKLAAPIEVYGASAMKLVVDTDDHYDDRYPGHVRVGIKNVSPATISNASLEIPVEGAKGYVAQPLQTRAWTVPSIAPGATWFPDSASDPDDDFIIVPQPTGNVDLTQSFITQAAGESGDQHVDLTQHPQVQPAAQAPELTAKRRGNWIILKWGAGAGATGYQAYGAPDRKTEFGSTPLPLIDAQTVGALGTTAAPGVHEALVQGGAGVSEVALSTVTPARLVLRHPTAEVIDGSSSHPTVAIDNQDDFCASNGGTLQVSGWDPDFNFSSLEVTYGGTTLTQPVTGSEPRASFELGKFPMTDTGTKLTVRGHLVVGGEVPEATMTLNRRGDTNCDGEIHAAIMGDSYISGEGAYGYMPGTDVHGDGGNLCHRSPNSWAALLAGSLGAQLYDPEFGARPPGDSVAFLACSGSVTKNFAGEPHGGDKHPQLDKLSEDEWSKLDLVFMSIGGNDAGFSTVIQICTVLNCAADSITDPIESAAMIWWRSHMLGQLPQVGADVGSVEGLVRDHAPQAEVYQVDYMNPFNPQPETCGSLSPTVAASDFIHDTGLYAAFMGTPVGGLIDAAAGLQLLSLTLPERMWVVDHFMSDLDDQIAWAAGLNLGADHVFDAKNVFAGHPICSSDPYVNGFTLGDDQLFGIVGNESFHPNAEGHAALFRAADDEFGATLGDLPNTSGAPSAKRVSAAATALDEPVTADLAGPFPGERVLVPSGTGTVTVQNGPPDVELRVTMEPLSTVVGSARTDASGDASIPLRLPASAAPGQHLLTIWNGDDRVQLLGATVTGTKACTAGADVDGDGLADPCDGDPSDGPKADFDGDGRANGSDNCPRVANPSQADADGDFEGDACDPDSGAARSFGAPAPATAGPPRAVTAVADGPGRAVISWQAPASGAVSGYRVSGGGRTVDVTALSAAIDGLAPGTDVIFSVAALTGGAPGAVALSQPVHITSAPAATPTPTPVPPSATPAPPVVTPPGATKPTISFAKTAKKIKLSRKGTFTLTFTATPGLKGTYTLSGDREEGQVQRGQEGRRQAHDQGRQAPQEGAEGEAHGGQRPPEGDRDVHPALNSRQRASSAGSSCWRKAKKSAESWTRRPAAVSGPSAAAPSAACAASGPAAARGGRAPRTTHRGPSW